MANPDRGEVDLTVAGKVYVLRFTTNAIRHLENLLDQSIGEIIADMAKPIGTRMGTLQCALWAALLDRIPDLSIEVAGEIVDTAGLPDVDAALSKALMLWLPVTTGGKPGNPQQAS